jgi:multiple sugar transport system substrate-binding protein
MNKWIYRSGIALSFLLVTACAPSQSTSNANTPKTITWLLPEDPEIDAYANQVAKAFHKKYPNVQVKVITPGSTAYNQKLLTMAAAGQTPDIFTDWGNTGIYTIISQHLAANLNPYFKQDKVSPNYIPATYQKEYSENGQLYGIPWLSNPTFIAYNKTLFEKYHVPLPPTSWGDKSWTTTALLNDAEKLTHKTSSPKTSDWGANLYAGSLGSLSWLWGADPLNNQGGPTQSPAYTGSTITQTYATSPGMVNTMQWLADLTTKYKVTPSPGTINAMSASGNAFWSGHIAIAEVAGWVWRQAAVVQPKFQWGIAPMPYGPGGADTAQREDNAFYLSSKSANPDIAFKLMLFATQGEGANLLVNAAKVDPPNVNQNYFKQWSEGISKISGFAMDEKTFSNVFMGGVNNDFPDPTNVISNSSDFGDPFTQLMAPVWLGRESAAQGLKNVQQAWQRAASH